MKEGKKEIMPSTRRKSSLRTSGESPQKEVTFLHSPDFSPATPDLSPHSPDSSPPTPGSSVTITTAASGPSPKTPTFSPAESYYALPDEIAAYDPLAHFRPVLANLRLTPHEGSFLETLLMNPRECYAQEKVQSNSLQILDDTWYIQERIENPSSSKKLQAMDSMWFQFRERQAKTPTSTLQPTPRMTAHVPEATTTTTTASTTKSHPAPATRAMAHKTPGHSSQSLDERWFQFDDPWFVYDTDDDEEHYIAPRKRPRLEHKLGVVENDTGPLGILMEFSNLDSAFECWNQ